MRRGFKCCHMIKFVIYFIAILALSATFFMRTSIAAELPNQTRYGSLGAVGVHVSGDSSRFTLEKFLANPIPGVKTLVMGASKARVKTAHDHGYFVIDWAGPTPSTIDICRRRAETGVDAIVTDEIGSKYINAAEIFNQCKQAAKKVNPNIQVGAVEYMWGALKKMMDEGAQPDFVGGEVYNGNFNLKIMNQFKEEYGVKTHMWLHGVEPERDLSYIGQVDLVVFADVMGHWRCLNQPCGSYLEELRASAAEKNWRTCYSCPWNTDKEFCCGDDQKCAGGLNSCGIFNCLANIKCNNKLVKQNNCTPSCQYGSFSIEDLKNLMSNWGKTGSPIIDLNYDEIVNSLDFAKMLNKIL